ncbi:MAG TPA: hypothetical protein VFO94_14115, partial [Gammaproteobacteria bacterium]|nr:hypothetical protein [Gammaproteobacteria bacterium]
MIKRRARGVSVAAAMWLLVAAPAGWTQTPAAAHGRPSVARALASVTPAVVSISVVGNVEDLLSDPRLGRLPEAPEELPRFVPRHAAGSGVIIDAEL